MLDLQMKLLTSIGSNFSKEEKHKALWQKNYQQFLKINEKNKRYSLEYKFDK